jgi:uncharacterized protein
MVPDLKAANYDAALNTALNTVAQTIADDAKVTLETLPAPAVGPGADAPAPLATEQSPPVKSPLVGALLIVFMLLSALASVLYLFSRIRKGILRSTGTDIAAPGTFSNSDSSSDSFSSSSDDDSFSGGDGGDSGGGGSSGSW